MRIFALASGVVPELGPVETVRAAAVGGFKHIGIWVEPARWTDSTTEAVRQALAETGLSLTDVEVIWLKPGPLDPAHLRILDIGLALNAPNALVVSSDPDVTGTVTKFRGLCEHVAGRNLRVALEFGLFTEVKTLAAASIILREADHPSAALLIDALHLTRSGGNAAGVAQVPREWLSYAQLCDAHPPAPIPRMTRRFLRRKPPSRNVVSFSLRSCRHRHGVRWRSGSARHPSTGTARHPPLRPA
jgi:sugar phosphate isomerase/epimerase